MKKVQHYHVTRRGGRPYSPWQANIALYYTLTRRGEWMASKHCTLSKSAIFNPKNPIFINLNPKLIGNSTYDHSTV